MKREVGLILVIVACVVGFLAIRGVMPFMPVFGTSMEPELHAGDLILIKEISPSEVKVGDIIVYNVPAMVREYYEYPLVVVHRVTEIRTTELGTAFRTKGDNTAGEDPFTVRAQDLRGQVSQQIRYLGFPLLFLHSNQGLIFIIAGLCLLTLYLYLEEFIRSRQKVQRKIFAPVIEESQRASQVITQRMESTEQTLERFSQAIEAYAQHLQSHTSAIQGLSEASQELKKDAAEQNNVLIHLIEIMEQAKPRAEEVTAKAEKIEFPPGGIRSRQQPIKQEPIKEASIFWAE